MIKEKTGMTSKVENEFLELSNFFKYNSKTDFNKDLVN